MIQRHVLALGATLLLGACAQFVDLRPVEVDVQLREAASDLQAGVRVRVTGAPEPATIAAVISALTRRSA
jgi:outer membrane biogenesis lipoprotein LolB